MLNLYGYNFAQFTQKTQTKVFTIMITPKIFIASALLTFSLFFQACSSDEKESANAMVSTNEYILTELGKTQYTALKTPTGFTVKGAENKLILIDIFATWCPPCQAEAKHLTSLQEKYKEELLVLGVTVEEGIEDAKLEAFKAEHNARYPMVNSPQNRRFITAVAQELKVGRNFGIPLMALYKDGRLVNFYQGAVEEEFLESDIKKALGK